MICIDMSIKCYVCDKEFKNNLGGQLTLHLERAHSMSLRDYVIKTKYDGIPPCCACGLCDEMPVFSRGKFLTHAKNHRRFSMREELYRKKYGNPVCQNPQCSNLVEFRRGKPMKYCSKRCEGLCNGFSLSSTQEKISNVFQERYGVQHAGQLEKVREAARKRMINGHKSGKFPMTDEKKRNIGRASSRKWKDPDYRQRTIASISKAILDNSQERKRRSHWLSERIRDPEFREKLWSGNDNRLSKLHQRIRGELNLQSLGFESEQRVLRYFADELNDVKKIIVEVNGDYIHANPSLFGADDVIRLPGQSYTAQEKWDADQQRTEKLEAEGYRVFVIWESDDLDVKKQELMYLLEKS